jgi:hypothetical protein
MEESSLAGLRLLLHVVQIVLERTERIADGRQLDVVEDGRQPNSAADERLTKDTRLDHAKQRLGQDEDIDRL